MIRLNDAIDMCWMIEMAISTAGYHVALRGSVLLDGVSKNDLDLIAYPHDSTRRNEDALRVALMGLGMKRARTVEESHAHWRSKGSTDEKRIEIWDWNGMVVDLLLA